MGRLRQCSSPFSLSDCSLPVLSGLQCHNGPCYYVILCFDNYCMSSTNVLICRYNIYFTSTVHSLFLQTEFHLKYVLPSTLLIPLKNVQIISIPPSLLFAKPERMCVLSLLCSLPSWLKKVSAIIHNDNEMDKRGLRG